MQIKNKNKSNLGTKHVCDFCGSKGDGPDEELWFFGDSYYSDIYQYRGSEANLCLEHFRLAHDDVEEFDKWYNTFCGDGEELESSVEEIKPKIVMKRSIHEKRPKDSSNSNVDDLIGNILSGGS